MSDNPKTTDMTLKDFYLNTYPTDELGTEINENTHFAGLLNELYIGGNVYEYIGVTDSLVRERLFSELVDSLKVSYDYVYNLWLKN